ncbi:MAG: hypothetical protein WD602_07755 [Actinomycetota bacterium]
MAALVVVAAAGACAEAEEAPAASSSPEARADVDWARAGSSVELEGWTVTSCRQQPPVLCVERDGRPAGQIRLEDLPSLGQEASNSPDQVQATLAVRINTAYQSWAADRVQRCGPAYEMSTDSPSVVTVAGEQGLKYGVRATVDGRVVERTVGYRVFRKPIETVIEATSIEPDGCVEPLENGFGVKELEEFESAFDRVAADGALPAPETFPSVRSDKPGSSADPRKAQVPSAGLVTEHRRQQP